jgi:hypothetical protein
VPRGFMRIRHYGITANRQRAHKLARCRELLVVTRAASSSTTRRRSRRRRSPRCRSPPGKQVLPNLWRSATRHRSPFAGIPRHLMNNLSFRSESTYRFLNLLPGGDAYVHPGPACSPVRNPRSVRVMSPIERQHPVGTASATTPPVHSPLASDISMR